MFQTGRYRKNSTMLIIALLVMTSMACGLLTDLMGAVTEEEQIILDDVVFPEGNIDFLHEIIPFGAIEAHNRLHIIRWRFYLSDISVDDAGDFYSEYLSDWQVQKDMEAFGHRHLMLTSGHPLSSVFTEAEFSQRLSTSGPLTPGLLDLEVAHSPAHHATGRSSYDPSRLPEGTIIIVVDYYYQDLQETPTAVLETPTTLETPPAGAPAQSCQEAISNTLCSNPYFPPVEGLVLVYQLDSGGTQTRQISQVQTNIQAPGEPRTDSFVVTLIDDNINVELTYRCTEEGLMGGDIGQMLVSMLEGQDMGGEQVALEATSFEGVMLPNQISPGDTWDAFVEVVLGAPDGVKLVATNNASYLFEGYQRVSVPAGIFEAKRISVNMLVEVIALLPDGHSIPLTLTQISSVSYYAECIGIIQTEGDMGLLLVDVIMP